MILDAERDIEHYDAEVSQLRSRILYLQAKQRVLKTHIRQLQSLSAPVRRLPVEVITHIFMLACRDIPVRLDSPPSLGWNPPFTLASVCKSWRQIVIGTPQLWCNVQIETNEASCLPQARLCLARSGSFPLSLEIDTKEDSLFDLLIEECNRWRRFCIHESEPAFLAKLAGNSFPLLEELSIDHTENGHPDLDLFCRAPRLHTLKTDSLPPKEELLDFPFGQILNLDLLCNTEDNLIFTALAMFPELQSVIIQDLDSDWLSGVSSRHVSRLSELVIGMPWVPPASPVKNVLGILMKGLTLPSLKVLSISHEKSSPSIWPREEIISLFERSKCSLTTLHLDHISVPHSDIITFLQLNPALTELRLKEIRRKLFDFRTYKMGDGNVFRFADVISPALLTALHAYKCGMDSLSSPLVPKLERLEFVADGDLFDDRLFLDMVVSRWIPEKDYALAIGVTSLWSVKITVLGRAIQEEVKSELEHLRKAGLKVTVG
ncbi:hypothetical protein VKT23_011067 [Stygiomarasmius scandens]|uniref:F-box domain-containing protein n=1 Tax=Marasmiellus scandens TaxID=2682957 RepID=A0ABR1JD68_9AGAR